MPIRDIFLAASSVETDAPALDSQCSRAARSAMATAYEEGRIHRDKRASWMR
jgi:hypothetical protein